jgi:glycosyltransferase involved in cell wall biosynthesis
MAIMAGGLARAGLLKEYISPILVRNAHLASVLPSFLPRPLVRAAERELYRRLLPSSLNRATLRRAATLLESLCVASQRVGAPNLLRQRLISIRNGRFDRAVGRCLGRGEAGIVSAYGAARHSFIRSKSIGIPTYLEYPIAHHRFSQRLLSEEAGLRPAYAETLQFHNFPSAVERQLDSELELADRIFMLSTFHKLTFLQEGVSEEKLSVTPLGVDLGLFRPTDAPVKSQPFRVLFVGQITQRKGISYLIDAFRKLSIPQSELILIGQVCGSSRAWAGTPGVRHIPHVPRSRLPQLYATATVFVLPSIIEGFGLTALEAMACGLPVIVSDHTFGRDLIEDGIDGYVVPIRDSEAIADRLRMLHNSPAVAKRIGVAARQKAERFSWDRYGERIVEVISSIDRNRLTSQETSVR